MIGPMNRIWAPIDWLADKLQHGIDTEVQERIAIIVIGLSLIIGAYGPFSGEPIFIYEMSSLALTLSGITWLAGLQAKKASEESEE